jgi:hypothetical protein
LVKAALFFSGVFVAEREADIHGEEILDLSTRRCVIFDLLVKPAASTRQT